MSKLKRNLEITKLTFLANKGIETLKSGIEWDLPGLSRRSTGRSYTLVGNNATIFQGYRLDKEQGQDTSKR